MKCPFVEDSGKTASKDDRQNSREKDSLSSLVLAASQMIVAFSKTSEQVE